MERVKHTLLIHTFSLLLKEKAVSNILFVQIMEEFCTTGLLQCAERQHWYLIGMRRARVKPL